MNLVPSVYATNQGGGAVMHARINVRGFNQRNVASYGQWYSRKRHGKWLGFLV